MRANYKATLLALTTALVLVPAVAADDWPQWLGPQRDGVWRETGILDKFPTGGPKVLWRRSIGGGYAGPAVADGRVYVTDRQLASGAKNPGNLFSRGPVKGTERVLGLNEKTGEVVWKHEYPCEYRISYPAGPRTTPVVAGGKVYTLGAMGDLLCLHAETGEVVWSKNFGTEYGQQAPMWGWSAHPLLVGDHLICMVGGEGTTTVAFHKDSGKEVWRNLAAGEPGYCPPMLYEFGGKEQLIIWHPETVNSLDPATGKLHWSVPFPEEGKAVQAGLTIPTPRKLGDNLFLTSFYNGPVMLKVSGTDSEPKVIWKGDSNSERRTDKLHAIMCTPFLEDGHIYGVCSYGQLRCLRADTGERVWETFKATTTGSQVRWANAFLIKQGDRFFMPNENGDLIIARLTPRGYEEIDRAHLLEPTSNAMNRPVVWSHPAFANKCLYARNDKEIICVSLAK